MSASTQTAYFIIHLDVLNDPAVPVTAAVDQVLAALTSRVARR